MIPYPVLTMYDKRHESCVYIHYLVMGVELVRR